MMDRRIFLQLIGTAAGISSLPGIAKAATNDPKSSLIIKAIGIGGAGGNIISRLHGDRIEGIAETICIDTDKNALDFCSSDNKILIGTGERLTSHQFIVAERLMHEHRNEIQSAVAGSDVVIVIAGLGGSTGTRMLPSVISHARRAKASVIAILITPFVIEGVRKYTNSDDGLIMAQAGAHLSITISNAAIADSLGEDRSLLDAFATSDQAVRNSIDTIILMANNGSTFLQNSRNTVDRSSAIAFCHLVEKEVLSRLPLLQERVDEVSNLTCQLNELDAELAQAQKIRLQTFRQDGDLKNASELSGNLYSQRKQLIRRLRILYETLDWQAEDTRALLTELSWIDKNLHVESDLSFAKINTLLAVADARVKGLGREDSPVYGLVL